MTNYPKALLKNKGLHSVRRKHPWVFSGALSHIDECLEGDIIEIQDKFGEFMGIAYYQDASISLRILSFEPCTIDVEFWVSRFQKARELRKVLGLPNSSTNIYRLIHGEGDHLPGLIIDMYQDVAVVQCHTIGIHKNIEDISLALQKVFGSSLSTIYSKSGQALPKLYAQHQQDGFLFGKKEKVICLEHNVKFEIDLINSQKTGFFIDQRDNRNLLGSFSRDKKVLNLFAYTGGFSLYALMAGASEVTSIDISEKAILQADKNVKLNGEYSNHQCLTEDVLSYLSEIQDDQFDIIVVDPPAFAKSVHKKHNAVQAYKRLNAAAIRKVKKNGFIFTFSCSQVIDQALFYHTITAAAMECNREIQVLHIMSQGADHPVNIFHPEGKYLKGLVLYVS